ncbi:MAG: TIGR00297 family protein [Archaeoglobaceae archaeon]|nr:TIGR00297 family protein [Archaeoglobaceae archaeon]MCX8152196.1 TIGR00297 family protein [Archaeoglobaceae archaeon]MDW8013912.1 TIGR00297 family protein [Archaeoglobaceae archaeon]
MLKLSIALISVVSILDQGIAIAMLTALLISYARKKEEINISEERNINFLILAVFLSFLSFFLPKGVVFAAIFSSLAHKLKGGVFKNLFFYTVFGFPFFFYYYNTISTSIFIALSGAIAASLVESVQSRVDKQFTVLLALTTAYVIFTIYVPDASIFDLILALTISLLLSYLAMRMKIADESGLLAATLCGLIVILFSDFLHFIVLLLFFSLGSAVTKYKYQLKMQLGIAEEAGGARGYANVLGNSLPALFFAMNTYYGEIFSAAFVSSVACALADTMASEIGKTAKKVYLITNFKRVKPGTSGGISFIGELAALLGCFLTFLVSFALNIVDFDLLIVFAAFVGVHVDSLLGATLEKKNLLTNSVVNLLATLSAGATYLALKIAIQ